MVAKSSKKNLPVHEATEEEWHGLIDRAARYHLNMSADEFIRKWNAGEFKDPDGTPVMNVAMLLPLGDPKAA